MTDTFACPNCGGTEWKADYYEAVWQSVAVVANANGDGTPVIADYTGVTGSYDDGSTENEALRCCSCEYTVPIGPVLVDESMRETARAIVAEEEGGDAGDVIEHACALARAVLGEEAVNRV